MPFVEVFSTPGAPRAEQKAQIAERLVAEVMKGEGAPDTEYARASLTDAKREAIVSRVTRVLADADDDPDRFYSSVASFVLLTEIPEGNWGGIGRVVRFDEIANFVMTGMPGELPNREMQQLLAAPSWEEARR